MSVVPAFGYGSSRSPWWVPEKTSRTSIYHQCIQPQLPVYRAMQTAPSSAIGKPSVSTCRMKGSLRSMVDHMPTDSIPCRPTRLQDVTHANATKGRSLRDANQMRGTICRSIPGVVPAFNMHVDLISVMQDMVQANAVRTSLSGQA